MYLMRRIVSRLFGAITPGRMHPPSGGSRKAVDVLPCATAVPAVPFVRGARIERRAAETAVAREFDAAAQDEVHLTRMRILTAKP